MPRILVVYFSRSGHTRQVAVQIAASVGADLEEIVDPTPRSGLFGYLRCGREAYFKRLPPIADAVRNPADYDLVIVGSPIWNASLSAPVRSYLRRYRAAMHDVAFFLTCGGFGIERALQQMVDESGRLPLARLTVRERDLGTLSMSGRIGDFVAEVQAAVTRTRVAQPA
jgi:flavodoxin